jgi:hypothetical protein
VALRNPFDLEARRRPDWQSGLSTAQVGPMAEDLVAVSFAAAGGGRATVALPMLDCGIDLYFRRLRSMLTIPVQVKAFLALTGDGVGVLQLPVDEVDAIDNGHLALVHLPPPHDRLYDRLFLIPFAELRRRCPRTTSHGVESFAITCDFAGMPRQFWASNLWELERLPEWFDAIPGWMDPIPPVPAGNNMATAAEEETAVPLDTSRAHWQGGVGRLWAATEIQLAGADAVVIAEDRVRLDTVTLLVHHLRRQQVAGLHVRTARISASGTVHFEVKRQNFFIDRRLYVLLVLLSRDNQVHDFCLLMPSEELPNLGYSETITIDRLTKRFQPYMVPSDLMGERFLQWAFVLS